MTSHLCGQLEILKTKFTSLGEDDDPSQSRIKLSALIARHGHLLELAEMLEAAYNMIIFTQLLVSVMLITVFGKFEKKPALSIHDTSLTYHRNKC